MTYCTAIATNTGLVFCSDSRTNAGPDMLSSYSKMHVFTPSANHVFCILSAGNLATTQGIIAQIELDLTESKGDNLLSCKTMMEAARYVASVNRSEQERAKDIASGSGIDTSASLIMGGQIRGGEHAVYLIYAAGNFISAAVETPYLQIGESKYGKPILDHILTPETSLEDAARCAIVSMDSTIKSNATVGPPVEVLVYETDSFATNHYINLEMEDQYLQDIRKSWDEVLKAGFSSLPRFDWEKRSSPTSPPGQEQQAQQQQVANMPTERQTRAGFSYSKNKQPR